MNNTRKSIVVTIDVNSKELNHVYCSHASVSFIPSDDELGDSIGFTWNLSKNNGEQDYDNAYCINEIRNTLKAIKHGKYSTMYFDNMNGKPLKYHYIKNGKLV